ncbi:MAG: hypothetical protein RLZZ301_1310 [Bacteroidota bacterium]
MVLDAAGLFALNDATGHWEAQKLTLQLEDPIRSFLEKFVPVTSKTATYFISEGCGIVYQYRNDSIFRIDQSFPHQNQFGGTLFMHNNEPHIYGGYGLFCYKDFITHYSLSDHEWFRLTAPENLPKARKAALACVQSNVLYILGGISDCADHRVHLREAWAYHFSKGAWEYLGKLNETIPSKILYGLKNPLSSSEFNNPYYVNSDHIYHLNVKRNLMEVYQLRYLDKIRSIADWKGQFLLKEFHHEDHSYTFRVCPQQQILSGLIHKQIPLIKAVQTKTYLYVLLLVASLLLTATVSYLAIYRKQKPRQASELNCSTIEKKLLQLLIETHDRGLEINSVYDFVNHDNPSLDTLKKRREQLLKELRLKLSNHFSIALDEVFAETRLETDKRMKLIFLNPKIIIELKKIGF